MSDPFIRQLKQKLADPLPGREAQIRMAHITRRQYISAPPHARQAGVMATLFQKDEAWHVVFIERNPNDKDRHGGQISFPGGKYEPEDASIMQTALREVEEEIGVPAKDINVLGRLSELYIPVSNFQVHPFVGYLETRPVYRLQEEEVSGVLEVPVGHFMGENVKRLIDIPVNKHLVLRNVPYYEVENKILWGATAMMMSELMEVIGTLQDHPVRAADVG